jgi:hypothetical protein
MCEKCERGYDTKEEAEKCETRKTEMYPRGMIFNNASDKRNHYENMTFCIAKPFEWHHMNESSMWAYRDSGMGDSLGASKCGGFSVKLGIHDIPDKDHPTFLRMV